MDETKPPEVASEERKPCIACREMIPASATVCSHCQQSQLPEKPSSFKQITGWVAGVTAIIGLVVTLSGGVQWIKNHWTQRRDISRELAVAESQTQRAEYEAAVATYQDILKKDPHNQQAADEQVTAAMRWAENFSVLIPEGKSATDAAAPKLDTILPILDAGLARAKGQRAADILAHIGWVHWLNWHIAEREYGPAAEQSFLRALEIDPSNVYANAMFGNWLLQNHRSLRDAVSHFAIAVKSGKERPFVRRMQVGGLIYNEAPQARAELVRVVNELRKDKESLTDEESGRILSFAYPLSDPAELRQALSAVPADESWATYKWLDDPQNDDQQNTDTSDIEWQQLRRDYIHANILELSGRQAEALSQYKLLRSRLKGSNSTLSGPVQDAIKRLAANQGH
jgi:hypothetical protein